MKIVKTQVHDLTTEDEVRGKVQYSIVSNMVHLREYLPFEDVMVMKKHIDFLSATLWSLTLLAFRVQKKQEGAREMFDEIEAQLQLQLDHLNKCIKYYMQEKH